MPDGLAKCMKLSQSVIDFPRVWPGNCGGLEQENDVLPTHPNNQCEDMCKKPNKMHFFHDSTVHVGKKKTFWIKILAEN